MSEFTEKLRDYLLGLPEHKTDFPYSYRVPEHHEQFRHYIMCNSASIVMAENNDYRRIGTHPSYTGMVDLLVQYVLFMTHQDLSEKDCAVFNQTILKTTIDFQLFKDNEQTHRQFLKDILDLNPQIEEFKEFLKATSIAYQVFGLPASLSILSEAYMENGNNTKEPSHIRSLAQELFLAGGYYAGKNKAGSAFLSAVNSMKVFGFSPEEWLEMLTEHKENSAHYSEIEKFSIFSMIGTTLPEHLHEVAIERLTDKPLKKKSYFEVLPTVSMRLNTEVFSLDYNLTDSEVLDLVLRSFISDMKKYHEHFNIDKIKYITNDKETQFVLYPSQSISCEKSNAPIDYVLFQKVLLSFMELYSEDRTQGFRTSSDYLQEIILYHKFEQTLERKEEKSGLRVKI